MWDGVLVIEFVAGRNGFARQLWAMGALPVQGAEVRKDRREGFSVHGNPRPPTSIAFPLTLRSVVKGQHEFGVSPFDHEEGQDRPQKTACVDGVKAPRPCRPTMRVRTVSQGNHPAEVRLQPEKHALIGIADDNQRVRRSRSFPQIQRDRSLAVQDACRIAGHFGGERHWYAFPRSPRQSAEMRYPPCVVANKAIPSSRSFRSDAASGADRLEHLSWPTAIGDRPSSAVGAQTRQAISLVAPWGPVLRSLVAAWAYRFPWWTHMVTLTQIARFVNQFAAACLIIDRTS